MLQRDRAARSGLSEQGVDQPPTAVLRGVSEAFEPGADLEILHDLLRPVHLEEDCRAVAEQLLEAFGSVGGALAASHEHLASLVGGPAAFRLNTSQRLLQHVLRERLRERPLIASWRALEEYLSVALRHERSEKLLVLFLDNKNGLIRDEVVHEGTVEHVPIYPREIAKRALQLDASAIIMVHNHPSGDASPSTDDIEMTKRVIAALAALDIAMHDHAIVGRNEVVSLRRLGAL